MVGWYLSKQARHALRTARAWARERGDPAPGSADLLLAAILGQWDQEHAGGPALLRACGMTAEQARQLNAKLLPSAPRTTGVAAPMVEPRLIGSLRFVVDQAYRIAAEARAPYVGTEHLVLAMLWQDAQAGAHELRRLGVSYARAAALLASLPHTEQVVAGEEVEPLEAMEVPTPAVASIAELARQHARQHPVDGRISTLHYLLAVLWPGTAAFRLLRELGVDHRTLVERLTGEGARLVSEDDHRRESPVEGWAEFRISDQQHDMVRGRVTDVLKQLWPQGVRFEVGKHDDDPEWWVVRIHPGESGLDPRVVLDRLLGHVS